MLHAVAGSLGILVQIALFVGVYFLVFPTRGHARGVLYGALIAVYGYALIISVGLLLALPWPAVNVALAVGLGLALSSARIRRNLAEGWHGFTAAARTGWAAILILTIVVVFHVAVAVVKPELSVDGELYHGPVLALLVQSGSLWGWTPLNEFTYYTDLTMAGGVNLASFTGEARFDDALQVPHLVVLVLAINFALASRFPRAWMRIGLACLVVSAPVIWMQPRILYVDLAYGTAVAVSILLIALTRRFGAIDIIVSGVAISAILATKPTGILTSLLLAAVLAGVVIWRRMGAGERFWKALGVAALGIGIPAFAALSFYVRNFISFSNPVYPVQVSMGPVRFPGIVDLSVFTSGERGTGLVDPGRIAIYLDSIVAGIRDGVTKLDYDPRVGGFGHVPLMVLGIVVIVLVGQLVVFMLRRRSGTAVVTAGQWVPQLWILGLSVAILVIQPSTFDARYVIGPTVAIMVALLMTQFLVPTPRLVDVLAVSLALLLAGGQMIWNERNVYPGAASILQMRNLDSRWQPDTPGNPWGTPDAIDWLPSSDDECFTIGVQTLGGLTASGMNEFSRFGTLPYGLYGDRLCNVLLPVTLDDGTARETGANEGDLPVTDFMVIYESDAEDWQDALPGGADCWVTVGTIESNPTYTEAAIVVRNTCD